MQVSCGMCKHPIVYYPKSEKTDETVLCEKYVKFNLDHAIIIVYNYRCADSRRRYLDEDKYILTDMRNNDRKFFFYGPRENYPQNPGQIALPTKIE